MNASNPNRQPKGIPTGGQFAASAHAEAEGVVLDPAASTDPWSEPDPTTEPTPEKVGETFGEPEPLSAEEFQVAVKADSALRMLDPEQEATMPDGSRVEIIPDPDEGSVVGGIVEAGTFAITRPDGSTGVRGFTDLGERGQVSQALAFETTYAARTQPDQGDQTDPAPSDDSAFPAGTVRPGNGRALGPDGAVYVDDPDSFWHGTEIISAYTRDQALADGALKDRLADGTDLNQMAREAGIPVPVAFTAAAFADSIAWKDSNRGLQDEPGRAWDALTMGARPIRAFAKRNGGNLTVGDRIPFTFIRVPNTPRAQQPRRVQMHAVFGVDDRGEPCFTFMMPDED